MVACVCVYVYFAEAKICFSLLQCVSVCVWSYIIGINFYIIVLLAADNITL